MLSLHHQAQKLVDEQTLQLAAATLDVDSLCHVCRDPVGHSDVSTEVRHSDDVLVFRWAHDRCSTSTFQEIPQTTPDGGQYRLVFITLGDKAAVAVNVDINQVTLARKSDVWEPALDHTLAGVGFAAFPAEPEGSIGWIRVRGEVVTVVTAMGEMSQVDPPQDWVQLAAGQEMIPLIVMTASSVNVWLQSSSLADAAVLLNGPGVWTGKLDQV